ncbi:hypothetical protein F5B19DRAFT_490501 [Rostrohypoxylon terebratum]|nr:hypothetical protein F5B19DRAFT_490501 [Rostrohypoxylon terebratum]
MANQHPIMEKEVGESVSRGPEISPHSNEKAGDIDSTKETGDAEGTKVTSVINQNAKGTKYAHGDGTQGKVDGIDKDCSKIVCGPSKEGQSSSVDVTKSNDSPAKVETTDRVGDESNNTDRPTSVITLMDSDDEDLLPLGHLHVKKSCLHKFKNTNTNTPESSSTTTLNKQPGIDFDAHQLNKQQPKDNLKEKNKKDTHSNEMAPNSSLSKKRGYDSDADSADEVSSVKKSRYSLVAQKPAKKRGRAANDDETLKGEVDLPKNQFRNMVDRYNTIVRREKFQALHAAVAECVKDEVLAKKIEDLALEKFMEGMKEKIKSDPKSAAMNAYQNRALVPSFDLHKKSETQTPDAPDYRPYTNTATRVNSSSHHQTYVDADDGQDGQGGYEEEQDVIFTGISTGSEQNHRNGSLGGKGTIVGNHKFEYPIYIARNTQNIPRPYNLRDHAVPHPETFTSREQANAKLLELTRYENFDGVTRKDVFEYTPLKLLKAKLTLSSGERRVLWVDRHVVDLRSLTKREQSSRKWSAKRPALPHSIVECEFMTRSTSEEPRRVELTSDTSDDEGGTDSSGVRLSDERVGDYTGDLELERLPLATFTDRQLANEHAGAQFLRHSAVREEIRTPLDDFWWYNNAVTTHREAAKKAGERDGRYVAEIYTLDMNTRLGFDWMRVAVYAVDDVTGPLNI